MGGWVSQGWAPHVPHAVGGASHAGGFQLNGIRHVGRSCLGGAPSVFSSWASCVIPPLEGGAGGYDEEEDREEDFACFGEKTAFGK